MVHVPLVFLSEWREFHSAPCLAEKNLTARVSILKLRASPDMLPFSLSNKTCNSAHEQAHHSDTIESVIHREVSLAKDLSASPRIVQSGLWRLSLSPRTDPTHLCSMYVASPTTRNTFQYKCKNIRHIFIWHIKSSGMAFKTAVPWVWQIAANALQSHSASRCLYRLWLS